MFRLGRCLLVGVQALLIFKENKITTPHPSHPRRKKKKPQTTNPKNNKAKPHKEIGPNPATLLQCIIQQFVF